MDFGFEGFESSDFDVDLQEIQIKKVKKFDRIWNIGSGGSINQRILGRVEDAYQYALESPYPEPEDALEDVYSI